MTKLRAPLTFAQGVTRIAGLLGWDEAARIVGRRERAVRLWSEPDKSCGCTLDQARNLDAAYRAAGGEGAPLLEAYAFQLEVQAAAEDSSRRELADGIQEVTRESSEAIASSVAILDPAATPAEIHRALAHADEARGAIVKLRRQISFFLPFAGRPRAQAEAGAAR
jgi:hypothetical protein